MYVCMYACMHACMHVCMYDTSDELVVDIGLARRVEQNIVSSSLLRGRRSRSACSRPGRRPPPAPGAKANTMNLLGWLRLGWLEMA